MATAAERALAAGSDASVVEKTESREFLAACLSRAGITESDPVEDILDICCDILGNTALVMAMGDLTVKAVAKQLFLPVDKASSLIDSCRSLCLEAGIMFKPAPSPDGGDGDRLEDASATAGEMDHVQDTAAVDEAVIEDGAADNEPIPGHDPVAESAQEAVDRPDKEGVEEVPAETDDAAADATHDSPVEDAHVDEIEAPDVEVDAPDRQLPAPDTEAADTGADNDAGPEKVEASPAEPIQGCKERAKARPGSAPAAASTGSFRPAAAGTRSQVEPVAETEEHLGGPSYLRPTAAYRMRKVKNHAAAEEAAAHAQPKSPSGPASISPSLLQQTQASKARQRTEAAGSREDERGAASAARTAPLQPTTPKPFRLYTSLRTPIHPPRSTDEMKMEEALQEMDFEKQQRARQLRNAMRPRSGTGAARQPTSFEPFVLTSVARHAAVVEAQQKQREQDEEEDMQKRQFRARQVDRTILDHGRAPELRSAKKEVTKPVAPEFVSAQRAVQRQQVMEELRAAREEERKLTLSESERRRLEEEQQAVAALRSQAQFKARKAPKHTTQPSPVLKPPAAAPTQGKAPRLRTDLRLGKPKPKGMDEDWVRGACDPRSAADAFTSGLRRGGSSATAACGATAGRPGSPESRSATLRHVY